MEQNSRRWTTEEEARLLSEILEGKRSREIARLHGRSMEAIRGKKKRMGIVADSPEELLMLYLAGRELQSLLEQDRYLAGRDYRSLLDKYRYIVEYFEVIEKSGLLKTYCKEHGADFSETENILRLQEKFEAYVAEHNERYIQSMLKKERKYLDEILIPCDRSIRLDEEQRRVVLDDEDYCLVIAGAGAGKTTTVAAKVRYLVERKGINPKDILVISFTNKAVNELKQRIIGELKIECPIATFHSTGNAIIRKQNAEIPNIVDSRRMYYVLQEYFRGNILKDERLMNSLVLFFSTYFNVPEHPQDPDAFFRNVSKGDCTTMRSELEPYSMEVVDARTKKKRTIQDEVLRSSEEVVIANFLYMNGIEYEYEPVYEYGISGARKPYTPDFRIRQGENVIYIEHFGITQDGKNSRFDEYQLEAYKRAVNDKVLLHRKHGTKLIYTFSSFRDGRSIKEHLQEQLEGAGIVLKPRTNEEIMEKLIHTEENKYMRKMLFLICRFLQNFKVNGYSEPDFARLKGTTPNERSKLFLDICHGCYLEYQRYLKENHAVDFEDMINESARLLKEAAELKEKLSFRYIIVDEYQDISRQRFDLISALRKVTDAKIMAVGDDWQSIYAFSGSDITLFTKFQEKMGYASLLKITRTYRNSQEIIDIAGNFIQKNSEQLKKKLISGKRISHPVRIHTYDGTRKKDAGKRGGAMYNMGRAVETALGHIVKNGQKKSTVLLLGRYGFDGDQLERTGMFRYVSRGGKMISEKYPGLDITFMTAHSSKGLGYDNVIVLNGKNEMYGFPTKIEDDPVLSLVVREDHGIRYAEERRLFYVAMTRTKNRVYFIAPEENPSEFLLEIERDYDNVELVGSWNENADARDRYRKICPMCGYPMQYRYKPGYGLRLFICTNEPEVCGFMTNEYGAGKLSVIRCDECRDGYLIARKDAKGGYFLGCTNYRRDGKGCNRTMSRREYMSLMHITDETPAEPVKIPAGLEKKAKEKKNGEIPPQEKIVIARKNWNKESFRGRSIDDIIYTALMCLLHISENRFYGAAMLSDVLRGSKNRKVLSQGLDAVPAYGAFREFRKEEVMLLIGWLLEQKYVHKTKGTYPKLHLTHEGICYAETITPYRMKKLRELLEKADCTGNGSMMMDAAF